MLFRVHVSTTNALGSAASFERVHSKRVLRKVGRILGVSVAVAAMPGFDG